MNNDKSPESSEENTTPYCHDGGSLCLHGPALVGLIRDILARGVTFRFIAPGFSMTPFIRDGDAITLALCQSASCKTGVVVAFVRPDTERLVVHRVVAVSKNGCHIRGDNTPEEDGVIPHTCIIGQVVRIERAGKTVRFGLGPERRIIALLSRLGWLSYCTGAVRTVCSAIRRFS